MIARHWRAIAKPEESENYISHLREETFPGLRNIEGFIRAFILKRTIARGTDFLVITVWQSIEAIRQFAGESVEAAVVPEKVRSMMIEYDEKVAHFEVAEDFS